MKPIFIFYSRDGHTATVAKTISKILKSEIIEVKEKKSRKGILGYIIAGWDGIRQKNADLINTDFDLSKYDPIIFGGPVWGFKPASPITTYMRKTDLKNKNVFNLVTMGGNAGKSVEIMKRIVKKKGGKVMNSFSIATQMRSNKELIEKAKLIAKEITDKK